MWRGSVTRYRGVLLGVILGLGLAGLLVVLKDEGVHMKQQPIMSYNAGDVIMLNRPLGKQRDEEKPEKQENEQNDKPVLNDGTISSHEPHPQNDLYKAYGHVNTIVFFIGYPRSRHSLLGSLLDAHPHMIVSDETMAFGRWRSGYQKKWINSTIYAYYDTMFLASQRSVSQGRRSQVFEGNVMNKTSEYKYYVPNQWQGNYDQYIQVIGDKAGAFTAGAMLRDDAIDAIHFLQQAAGAKVKFVHVVRNPFDNIATMVLEHRNVKGRSGEHEVKVNSPKILDEKMEQYFRWAEGCNKVKKALPGSVLDVPSMEIVKNPANTLRKICTFLDITCAEQYLQDCAATVHPVPSITRDFIEWTAEQKNSVYERMRKFSFFEGFSYEQ